ncbi:MAG: DUF1194 domain-containing protein [Pseudomonadota bacterium]
MAAALAHLLCAEPAPAQTAGPSGLAEPPILAEAPVLAEATDPAAGCRLALALGLDISSSVNSREYAIQLGGLANALRAPDIQEAMLTQSGEVWITVYEWSGWQQQDVILPWSPMRAQADVEAAALRLDAHRRVYEDFSTALGRAMRYGAELFRALPRRCDRQVIDLSGDGVNNDAETPTQIRASGVLNGITLNALVIDGAYPSPVEQYRDQVITGPGAFMLVARNGFDDYPDLIRGKLLRELQPDMLIGRAERSRAPGTRR